MAWLEGRHESGGENDNQHQLLGRKKIKFIKEREREREVVHSPREVVGLLLVVDMMMVKPMVKVLVAGGGGGEREREREERNVRLIVEMWGRLIFYRLWT